MKNASRTAWAIALFLGMSFQVLAQPAPVAGRSLPIEGMEMYFEDFGKGEPLVLLHGFGGCGRDWRAFSGALSSHFRVIVPDMRGHGRSTNPLGAFTHRQAAADVSALLDRLGITRFKAIGISSGGMTLLHMATREPSRIEAMVLVGAAHHFPEQARRITRAAAEHGPRPGDMTYYRQCASRGDAQVEELATQFAGFSRSYDDVDFDAARLATIRARTLIVHGDRDEFFPVGIPVEMYAAIPASALWIVPQGSHVPIFDANAKQFLGVAQRFLQGPAASR